MVSSQMLTEIDLPFARIDWSTVVVDRSCYIGNVIVTDVWECSGVLKRFYTTPENTYNQYNRQFHVFIHTRRTMCVQRGTQETMRSNEALGGC